MKKALYLTILLGIYLHVSLYSQNITVEPYLQNADTTSIVIMWETDSDPSTQVEYGITAALGSMASGSSSVGFGSSQVHTVALTGLIPATRYYYKVVTGSAESAIYDFITPPRPEDETETRLIAVSDMQRDFSNPTIWNQVVQDGIIDFITNQYSNDLPAELQLVIIPGDLVNNGLNYSEWETTFFDPQHPLFAHVPLYPVLGNHENNTPYYFNYFNLPLNGTPGYDEHWWYKDHSNVRIIGLNSNGAFQISEQLDWLDTVLNDASTNPNIDFVFVQLHHPFQSELWPPGNTNYTGQIIPKLENFSTTSGKPSIHFYGHTHGYSRGNSRDHNHMMVNVATAGGNIDYWGEYAQVDYPEYLRSDDEYGFVFVTVEAGSDPKFTLHRYNMGDGPTLSSYSLIDQVTIKKNNNNPVQPTGIFPAINDVVNPDCVILKGSDFTDPDADEFGAAHWQVSSAGCSDFSAPVVDSWKQYMNLYNEIDLQASDDLTDEKVTGLDSNTNYCWRVRYRDKSLAWSNWSTPIPFSTGSSDATGNLLSNPGAENGITDWTATTGVIESLLSGECSGIAPYAGIRYFAVGALCNEFAFASANQVVDVNTYITEIDNGLAVAKFGGYLSNYGGSDIPSFAVHFLDGSSTLIGSSDTTSHSNNSWTLVQNSWAVPAGTRNIRFVVMGTRNAGVDNDSYFDELYLRLNLNGDSCSQFNPSSGISDPETFNELDVYPNPLRNGSAFINVPNTNGKHLDLKIFNMSGQIIREQHHIHGPTATIPKADLTPGMYLVVIYHHEKPIGQAKLLIQ